MVGHEAAVYKTRVVDDNHYVAAHHLLSHRPPLGEHRGMMCGGNQLCG